MRRLFVSALFNLVLIPLLSSGINADVSLGITADDDGLKSFYLAVGDHYRVPDKEIIAAREKRIPDEELPVIFYIARKADVHPSIIIDMRLLGRPWMDITLHFKLSPEIYYVKIKEDPGPPYGRALGHFRNREKSRWGTIVLNDVDIINLVNLRLASEYYKLSPEQVIKWRGEGKNFVAIHKEIKKVKSEGNKKEKNRGKDSSDKQKEKSKGKAKERG